MTQTASNSSIKGDFDNVLLAAKNQRFFLSQEHGKFYFQKLRKSRVEPERTQILMVTGSHHYQVYWYSRTTDRKVHAFPFVYLFKDKRWVPRGSETLGPPTKRMAEVLWNNNCLTCHSTRPFPRVADSATDTHVAEFGIACEACHGPGKSHIEKMQDPLARFFSYVDGTRDETIVNPSSLDQHQSVAVCAQCHSYYRRHDEFNEKGHLFQPGDDDIAADRQMVSHRATVESYKEQYRKHFEEVHEGDIAPHRELISPQDKQLFWDIFWPDGVTRAIGREYTAIEPSPCFQRGDMTCLSCHDMHRGKDADQAEDWRSGQLKPAMRGNEACTQCHQDVAAGIAAHTHHESDSAGSQCMSCHMPRNAYGLLSARVNHQLQSPSTISSAEGIGRINGCNICHQDKSLGWTAQYLNEWYDHEIPTLTEQEQEIALIALHAVKGHAGQRVLAASLMGWPGQHGSPGWQVPFLVKLLDDEYDAIRIVSYRSLKAFPGFADFDFDYMRGSRKRAPGIARAEVTMRTHRAKIPAKAGRILYRHDGTLDERRYSALRTERNHRRIWIGE